MKALALRGKSILWLRFLPPISAFLFGFFISYQQDKIRVSEAGQTAWLHWSYATDLNDDMAVIDWSKNLEGMENVLAFQAVAGSKVVAEGGNHNYLPVQAEEGVSFEPSGRWLFVRAVKKDSQNSRKFILVYSSAPGPLLWGAFGGGASLFSLILAGAFSKKHANPQNHSPEKPIRAASVKKSPAGAVLPFDPSTLEKNKPLLFIDKQYLIQQVTPEAALLLQKTSADLLRGHLFDLKPNSRLMQAIDGNEEVKLLNPFLSYPSLSVNLKPDRHGTLLFLERVEETKVP